MTLQLDCNSLEVAFDGTLLAAWIGIALAGFILDLGINWKRKVGEGDGVTQRRENGERGLISFRWTVIGLTAGSYMLLVPGLLTTFLRGRANVFRTVDVDVDADVDVCTMSGSILGLIAHLAKEDMWLGAALLALIGVIIPAINVLLMALGESWRGSKSRTRVQRARLCFLILQALSKWACPVLFAGIFLQQAFRDIDHSPTLASASRLDMGFAAFCCFCLGSTLGATCFQLPEFTTPAEGAAEEHVRKIPTDRRKSRRAIESALSRAAAWAAAVLGIACLVSLGFGLWMPCMELRLDTNSTMGGAPLDGLVAGLGDAELSEASAAELSVMRCLEHSARGVREGGAVSALVCVLLAIFVVALPGLESIALLTIGFLQLTFYDAVSGGQVRLRGLVARPGLNGSLATLRTRKREFADGRWECDLEDGTRIEVLPANFEVVARVGGATAAVARILHKLSMLDVLIVGVMVLCVAGRGLQESGAVISTREGLWMCLAAEAFRRAARALAFVAISPLSKVEPIAKARPAADAEGKEKLDKVHASATSSTRVPPGPLSEVEEVESSTRADGDSDTTYVVRSRTRSYDWDIGDEASLDFSKFVEVEIRASPIVSFGNMSRMCL